MENQLSMTTQTYMRVSSGQAADALFRRTSAPTMPHMKTLDELRALPEEVERGYGCGVYFLWDGDELVYVGGSKDMNNRRYIHHVAYKYSPLGGTTYHNIVKHTRCTMLSLPRETFREIERQYIWHYCPRDNKQSKPAC